MNDNTKGNAMGDVTVRDFNGLGERVNSLAVEHATCKGATASRLDSMEKHQDEVKGDVKELFNAVDKVRLSLSSLNGRMVGMGIVLSILIPVMTSFLMKILFN